MVYDMEYAATPSQQAYWIDGVSGNVLEAFARQMQARPRTCRRGPGMYFLDLTAAAKRANDPIRVQLHAEA